MIEWNGIHDEFFKMDVQDYAHPSVEDGYEANWLTVGITAENEAILREESDGRILSWELEWFAYWLDAVQYDECENRFSVLDCGLTFHYICKSQGKHRITATLERFADEGDEVVYDVFHLAPTERKYKKAIFNLFDLVNRFGVRGRQGKRSRETLPGPEYYSPDVADAFDKTDTFIVQIHREGECVEEYEILRGSESFEKLSNWAFSNEFCGNWYINRAERDPGIVFRGGGFEFNFCKKQVVVKSPTGQFVKFLDVSYSDYEYVLTFT